MFRFVTRLMRRISRRTALYIGMLAVTTVIAGAVLFSHFEHMSFWTSLYWSISTATTAGYGDVIPVNSAGRVIAVGVMLTSIPLFGSMFTVLAAYVVEIRIRGLTGIGNLALMKDHIVVLGYSDESPAVIEALRSMATVVVVAEDVVPELLPSDVVAVKGDPREADILVKARITHARHAVITGLRDGDMLEMVIVLREIAPHLAITASTKSAVAVRALKSLGVAHTVNSQELLGHILAKTMQSPHATELLLSILNSDEFVIDEIEVDAQYIGRPFHELRAAYQGFVLGLVQGDDIALGVRRDPVVQSGNRILYLRSHR